MKKLRQFLVVVCFLAPIILGSRTLRAQTTRGITAEDYLSFAVVSDPHLSPDGKEVAYVPTNIDQKKNRRESSVWLLPIEGSAGPRRMSAEGFSSSNPRWSPDGKTLAILSARASNSLPDEKPKDQIYILPATAGGEGMALTNLKNGVGSYQWSPDGTRIVAVSASGPGDQTAAADRQSDVRHYTHIIYKFNDSGWDDGKRHHLWVVNVQNGEALQVTDGQNWNDAETR